MTELVVRALLTADKVLKEDNGKHSAIGIFDRFNVISFPATLPPWGIYVSLANLSKGDHKFAVNLVHDETSSAVLGLSGDMSVKEQGSGIEMGIPVLTTTLPRAGRYTMSLHVNGDHVASRTIEISQLGATR